jgi:hypothetical protein
VEMFVAALNMLAIAAIVVAVLSAIVLWARSKASCIERGARHNWMRHPSYWRTRVCCDCGRCETLHRQWEYDGVDMAYQKVTSSTNVGLRGGS